MPGLQDVAEQLSTAFDTRVTVSLGKRKGKIVVEFGSVDDLQRIVELMNSSNLVTDHTGELRHCDTPAPRRRPRSGRRKVAVLQHDFDPLGRRDEHMDVQNGPLVAQAFYPGRAVGQFWPASDGLEPRECSGHTNHASPARGVRAAAQARTALCVLGGRSVDAR